MTAGWVVGCDEEDSYRPAWRSRHPSRRDVAGRARGGDGAPAERRPAALPVARRTWCRDRAEALARPAPRLVRLAPRRPRPLSAGDDLGHRAAVSVARRDRDRVPDGGAPE